MLDTWSDILLQGTTAIAAWVALIVSVRNARVSRRALALAETKAARETHELVLYHADATSERTATGRLLEVSTSISNPTDLANSISRVELVIAHLVGGSTLTRTVLPAERSDTVGAHLVTPLRIDAHGTVAGTLQFIVPNDLIPREAIREYTLAITDAQGITSTLAVPYMREI